MQKPLGLIKNLFQTIKLLFEVDAKLTCVTALLDILVNLNPIIQATIVKNIIDQIVQTIKTGQSPETAYPQLLTLVAAALGVSLLAVLLGNYSTIAETTLIEKLVNHINYKILTTVNKLQLSHFEDPKFFDHYEKVSRNSSRQPVVIMKAMLEILDKIVVGGSFLIVILKLQPLLVLSMIIATVPIFVFDNFVAKKIYFVADGRAPQSRFVGYLKGQLFSNWGVKELRIFGLDKLFYSIYKKICEKFYFENKALRLEQGNKKIPLVIISETSYYAAYFYIAFKALAGSISLGSLSLYTSALSKINESVRRVFKDVSSLYESNFYLSELYEFLALKPDSYESSGTKKIHSRNLKIEVKDLSFKYPGSKNYVLKDVNLSIKAGESIALAGRNGAGKTTLIKLLCGFYPPTAGKILVNGVPLDELDLRSYRQMISVIFQDFSYYQFSAADNIGFGNLKERFNRAKIIAAAKKAGAHEFIEKYPDKYDQRIGKIFKGGIEPSLGQFQKLSLARAFMRDAPLLILDEPTASSDPEAEMKLFERIEKEKEERAVILISHRFSTVKMAHKIYVIDQGKIVESGSHQELLKKRGGLYAKLYKIQASGYKD